MRKINLILITLLPLFFSTSYADVISPQLQDMIANTKQSTLTFLNRLPNQWRTSKKYEKHLQQNYLKHYYAPWNDQSLLPAEKMLYSILKATLARYEQRPGFDENHYPHTGQWIEDLRANINLSHFPNSRYKAITINRTNLRILPTDTPSFEDHNIAGQGFPFDNLQNSSLHPNLPVYVLHTSRNSAWKFILTPNFSWGWVRTNDIATVSSAFIKQWETKQYVTASQSKLPIMGNHEHFFFLTRLGSIYPLVSTKKQYYQIYVAVKDSNDKATIKIAKLKRPAATHWPIAATSRNIALHTNQFLGQPYGWGGIYGYRDCSETVKDVFSPFAIWMPRNSTNQAHAGQFIAFTTTNNQQKHKTIMRQAIPFFTLLWVPGHILIYVGHYKDRIYVFHDVWGVHTADSKTGKAGRDIIGRTVITPLNLGQGLVRVKSTWLDKVKGLTYLVPKSQLMKVQPKH